MRASAAKKILIVDDDESVTSSLSMLLKRAGYVPLVAFDPALALALVQEHQPDLVIHDMNFSRQTSGEEGLQLLQAIRQLYGQTPVVLITAWGSIDLAVKGMKAGANDFLAKPWSNERLLQVVATALEINSSKADSTITRARLDAQYDLAGIVGQSPVLLQLLETVGRISATDASVLILGESGTGKELIADAIHANSKRRNKPLVKVNLGGIPGNLFESEMFGHVKGAFTDAKSERVGRFEAAGNGSIFLDEIGDLDKASQVKLLRVLQDQSYQPLGSSTTRTANVRVIAATNHDLDLLVTNGLFREDLLYRINLITLRLPPLRERKEDIPELARHMVQEICQRYGYAPLQLSDEAVQWLQQQLWPGNIRELRQTIERAVLISDTAELTPHSFQNAGRLGKQVGAQTQIPDLPVGTMTLEEMERAMILKALSQYRNNLTQVANALGLSRPALYRRLEKYGVSV
ncbi:MAG: sigma-54 dependent transcriptional regulator [Gammaproteobacteria bacterium]|nr:sigma-54 dependent transcriptional regulator [Gammaproteobacteria bacterium]MDP2141448.1 sigma-54 dependent transcriptional regulator [Gammaproteobacteria bacterium]MDP2347527.1 sigma-54 dependent transcriptional regulator [Gammaproteobacteria bacterium]